MDYFKKKCKRCGKAFLGTRTQQYCSVGCRQKPVNSKKIEKKSDKPRAKTTKKKTVPTIDEMATRARELGMTYGKYVEMLTVNEEINEREMRVIARMRKERKDT